VYDRMKQLLEVKGVNKNFDGIRALSDFSCHLKKGEILGLIGPNGAGKSTLFNVITGFIPGDSGSVRFNDKNITGKSPDRIAVYGISRTFQILRLIYGMSILDNVLLSYKNQPGEHLRNIFFRPGKSRETENRNRQDAMALLDYAGIADKADDLAGNLSYGQQKLLSLVCCLASDADLLLLDEPISGLNPVMIDKILSVITDQPKKEKSVILIEHNLDAVIPVCDRLIFMDEGKKISEGTPEEVRKDSRVIDAYID